VGEWTIFTNPRKIFLWAVTAASLVPASLTAGVRVGNGGDPIDAYLELIRKSIYDSLGHLKDNYPANHNMLVDYCNAGRLLTAEERETCISFLQETADAIRDCNDPSSDGQTPLWAMDPSTPEDFIRQYAEGPREVSATTIEGCATPIEFYYDRVKNIGARDLMILMAHEFGHKIEYRGQHIDDIGPVGGFTHGEDLLNTAAYALMYYAMQHRLLPLYITRLPIGVDWFECSIDIPGQESRPFRFFSPRNGSSSDVDNEYQSLNLWDNPYGKDLTPLVSDITRGERLYLRFMANDRGGCDRADPLDATDFILMRGSERDARTVGGGTRAGNVLCETPPRLEVTYESMTIRCTHDGHTRT
jgi:hypothetical protein